MSALDAQLSTIDAGGAALVDSETGLSQITAALKATDATSWLGPAADAFRNRRGALVSELMDLGMDAGQAGRLLIDHASAIQALKTEADDARTDLRAAWTRLTTVPPDLSALSDVLQHQRRLSGARRRAETRAELTAAQLYGLIAVDTTGMVGLTWPPAGWPEAGTLLGVSPGPDAVTNSSFDPLAVHQGSIGDCYLVATVMALMESPEGDQILRDAMRWDADRGGWWVTLYEDSAPVVYFVDRTHSFGAGETHGQVAAILEAAVEQHLEYSDLTDGGWPKDSMELLTGRPATEFLPSSGDSQPWDIPALRQEIAHGGELVASTGRIDGHQHITVTAGSDGSTETRSVEIIGAHAYAVVSVEPDGSVWVMNPHGPGNGADDGGAFRISATDFATYFRNVASTGPLK